MVETLSSTCNSLVQQEQTTYKERLRLYLTRIYFAGLWTETPGLRHAIQLHP